MSFCEGVFSLRLVIADFYMEKPILGLDPVYSEFRGKEIKKVPIIRVFGSNNQGQKTCMHIHGVFPYFYVPYDQKDFESLNKALHQMAMNIDKAINISLSQGSSAAQHVFKVQLVKGIPFYGYHRSEHHYLKIYMFNPRFVRRAANLLQNGAIMNKNFHPHEAHVPYVLQFMIDHNLYGMSLLHVPLEIVKFRRSDATEQIHFKNLRDAQILDHIVAKKMSCSTLEIDIGSNFILNRFQLISKTNATHTNPGIESIWNDERLRRQKMTEILEDDEEKLKAIPPLEVPLSQERTGIYPTESETFYRTALVSKLAALDQSQLNSSQSSDQTIGSTFQTNLSNQKMTFNLKKILQNSVYPEECTQNENLTNASFIENHLSSKNAFEQSLQMDLPMDLGSKKEKLQEDESVFLDDTLVDEEQVLNLTQPEHQVHVPLDATLRDEDLELLDILQTLETENNGSKIDLDSSLAPLTQENQNYDLPIEIIQKKATISEMQNQPSSAERDGEDIDEENVHDFSIALESLDDLILKFTQSQTKTNVCIEHQTNVPNQIDGSDDLLKTPKKSSKVRVNKSPPHTPTTKPRRFSQASPSRSPKTPKCVHKTRPLPLIITNLSAAKKNLIGSDAETTPTKIVTDRENDLQSAILRKRITLHEFRRKTISIESDESHCPTDMTIQTKLNRLRANSLKDLDKTHITCNLTPRKTNEKCLKVYTIDEHNKLDTQREKIEHEATSKSLIEQENKNVQNKEKDYTENFASFEEHDEEFVVASEDESTIQLRKTPNLKILRRSLLSSRSIKRQHLRAKNAADANSSKFVSDTKSREKKLYATNITECVSNTSIDITRAKNCLKSIQSISKTNAHSKRLRKLQQAESSISQQHLEQIQHNIYKDSTKPTSEDLIFVPIKQHRDKVSRCGKSIKTNTECQSKVEDMEIDGMESKLSQSSKSSATDGNNETKSINKIKSMGLKNVCVRLRRIQAITVDNSNPESVEDEEKCIKNLSETLTDKHYHNNKVNAECQSYVKDTKIDEMEAQSSLSSQYSNLATIDGNNETKSIKNNCIKPKLKTLELKNVCVRLRRIQNIAVNDSNPERSEKYEETSNTNFSQTIIDEHNHNNKGQFHCDKYNNAEKGIFIEKTTCSDKSVIENSPGNLFKTLLKFHSAIGNNKSANILSLGKDSECVSSQLSTSDIFQDSQLTPLSSDNEMLETPQNGVSNFEIYSSVPLHSPPVFSQHSSENIISRNNCPSNLSGSSKEPSDIVLVSSSNSASDNPKQILTPVGSSVVLTPLDLPPTREEVLSGSVKLKLHDYEFQQPFYSNPDDITKQKELGFTILQINGNKLNDLEDFQSLFGADLNGLSAWRRRHLLHLGGPEMLNKYRNNQRMREYFAGPKAVTITPLMHAPTRLEAKLWLKARELLNSKDDRLDNNDDVIKTLTEEDSPIKIRRQKVTMMLNIDGGESGEDGENNLDCSTRSLSLTPMTPATPLSVDCLKGSDNKSVTPVTTKFERIPLERLHSHRKRNNRRVLKRVSLNKKMQEALEAYNSSADSSYNSKQLKMLPTSDECLISNSQKSESSSVSSETAWAEMERLSFMHQLQQHDVSMGCSNNNSTFNNTLGFKVALENLQQAKADIEYNYLTIITLEVFVATRDDLYPNPQIDEIRCLFYAIENNIPNDHIDKDKKLPRTSCGYIMVHDFRDVLAKEGNIHGIDQDIAVSIVQTEVEALETLLGLCSRWDPDIYAGYEIEMSSWGFVIERAKYLCLNIAPLLSRVPSQKSRDFVDEDREQFTDLDVEMKLCGRILLDVWRLMRSEIALTSYSFENVMYHIMHKRCPWHSYRTLTAWFSSQSSRWIVIEYYLERVRGTLALLDQLDLIGRTSEMAKLIGIQFYEVLSRGSQFRVESMMLRIAKPKNLVPLSPSVQQRAHMRAPEYLPLILEPQSRFYADPLIVLDFQSLYPSMIIGYNYCFSTCLGRVEHLGDSSPFEFGASQLRVSPSMLRKLVDSDLITISPCGVVFVKPSVREGILPRMLSEILDTRQMVKQSMKVHKTNSALQRILHSRQLGLKLMANTTYGYTAANFSGRMPAVEVGDSVVAKGRETLERAIKTVEANEKWNVKVVYGDTDSLFVLVPGRSREQAFRIGEEIAEAVTKLNPQPVKLKLEKVYQPCILQTKKRYVGYMYENPDQKEPVYEAKGIETVRRDGCPIVAKMLEKVLRILFESADVSHVKKYVCRQFTKLLSGRASLQDLIFAKEFRGINGYKPSACVPALELTRKWLQTDPRRIPRRGERVPFIIANGPPGVPLIRLIRHPHEMLGDEGLKINAIYYITKAIIPPLNRCLLLLGADVNEWFANLPRKVLMTPALSVANEIVACPNAKSKKSTISQFFSTTNCIADCGRYTKQGICMECIQNPLRSVVILQTKISRLERAYLSTRQLCQSCCGRLGDIECGSLDCPVLYVLEVKCRDLQQIRHFRNILEEKFSQFL